MKIGDFPEVTSLVGNTDHIVIERGGAPKRLTPAGLQDAMRGPAGNAGTAGWTPVFAVVADGSRLVQKVTDWVGGGGAKPGTGVYVGASGLVSDIASAVDIRGAQGIQGIQGLPAPIVPPVIFDTDLCTDAGDGGAIAMLNALAARGECTILAATACSSNDYTAPALYGIMRYHGRGSVPIGAYKANDQPASSTYTQTVAARFGRGSADVRANYPSAVSVMRRALAKSSGGVVGIAVGPMVNWSLLLSSPADAISPLTGAQLVAAKMARLVVMGGQYPSGPVEWNFQQAPAAAAAVCSGWPTPIVFVGYEVGGTILPSFSANADGSSNPYTLIYAGGQRYAWDETAVLVAVRDKLSGINGRVSGTNSVNSSTGGNTWSNSGNQHSYAVKTDSDATLQATMEGLYLEVSLSQTAPHNLPYNTLLAPVDSSLSGWTANALNVALASSPSPRLGPDWATYGTRLIPTTASTFHYASKTITKAASSIIYEFQAAFYGNGYNAYIQLDDTANGLNFNFDLTNKVFISGGSFGTGFAASGIQHEIFDCGDGWSVCRAVVSTSTSTTLRVICGLYSGAQSFAGDTSKSVDVWLPQLWN